MKIDDFLYKIELYKNVFFIDNIRQVPENDKMILSLMIIICEKRHQYCAWCVID